MGHKVHPIGFRLGIVKDWETHWFAEKDYTRLLHEDIGIRQMIQRDLRDASVPRIEIERSANQVTVTIHTAKPGIVIGKSGAKVEDLRRRLETKTGKKVRVNINEIRQPELDATLVARSIAEQLERTRGLSPRHEAGRHSDDAAGGERGQGNHCRSPGRRRNVAP